MMRRVARMWRYVRRFGRDASGNSIVEFALIAPLLFLLLFGVFEFGIFAFRWSSASEGARIGARIAMVRSITSGRTLTKAALQDSVRNRLRDQTLTVDSMLYRNPNGTTGTNDVGDRVRIVVSYPSARITGRFAAMKASSSAESVILY